MSAYGTIADWRTYAAARGDDAPTSATEEAANEALQRATDYIRTQYIIPLSPQYAATDDETIEATYIAASLDLATPGFWATTFTPSQAKVLTKVEGIQWTPIAANGSASSAASSAASMVPASPMIEALFRGASAYGTAVVVV